jgi:hypothetical protein
VKAGRKEQLMRIVDIAEGHGDMDRNPANVNALIGIRIKTNPSQRSEVSRRQNHTASGRRFADSTRRGRREPYPGISDWPGEWIWRGEETEGRAHH